jgi:DNA-binding CsgD family transcriptional regulator
MFLAIRAAVPDDLAGAFAFVRKRFHIPADDDGDLRKMWGQILAEAACSSLVVEDLDRDEGDRIAAFGLAFCVPECQMNYVCAEAPPFLWRWTLARWREGRKLWLEKREARRTQIDGEVSLFAFASADVYRYAGADLGRVTNMLSTAAARELAGYRVGRFVLEAYGPLMRDRLVSHGMTAQRDYHEHHGDKFFQSLPKEQRPFLMFADFQKAALDLGLQQTSIGRAALAGPPRYGFSEHEQEVLKLALLGLTDQAIAEKLDLSLVAIKKRWEGVYEKVGKLSHWQPPDKAAVGSVAVKIGRRQVLQMVAEHPEEFRPSPPKKRLAR